MEKPVSPGINWGRPEPQVVEQQVKESSRNGPSWKLRPGDVVRHQEYNNLIGVVVQPKLVGEVDDSIVPDEPDVIPEWYLITWVITPEGECCVGQECEAVLVLVFRPNLSS